VQTVVPLLPVLEKEDHAAYWHFVAASGVQALLVLANADQVVLSWHCVAVVTVYGDAVD
jgi:hypothetical protein